MSDLRARLRALLPTRASRITVALGFVYSACIGFLPLFGTMGYEQALAAGLFFPGAAAIWTALDLSADKEISPGDAVLRGIANGVSLGLLALVVSLVHTVRSGSCDVTSGIMPATNAAVVMRMGRRRSRFACRMAALRSMPASRS